jgi:hypothetical protein
VSPKIGDTPIGSAPIAGHDRDEVAERESLRERAAARLIGLERWKRCALMEGW